MKATMWMKMKQFTIEQEVRKKLMKFNPAKSSVPDNLHSKALKELANVLDKPLKILFQNTSLKKEIEISQITIGQSA